MRKISLILAVCLLLNIFAGCSADDPYIPTGNALEDATVATEEPVPTEEAEENTFTLAYYAQEGFNPYTCTGYTNRLILSLIYQGLFTVDREYHVEPMLCSTYSVNEDMTRYTFHLEPATFPDGSRVTAGDVVASFNAAAAGPVYEGRFRVISGYEAVDDNTLVVSTVTECETLPMLLDIPIVKAGEVSALMPQGTGPYRLVKNGSSVSLSRRDSWWSIAQVPVEQQTIELWPADGPVQIRDWFEFDEVGIVCADPGAGSYVDYRCDYEVWDCETGIMLYLVCNTTRAPFGDSEMRKAVSWAVDRSTILEECYNSFGVAATLPASPNSPFYDQKLGSQVGYEPQRLRQLVEEKQLTGVSLQLLVNKDDSTRLQAARIIAQTLNDCGLNVTLDQQNSKVFYDRLYAGNFDLYLGQTQLSPNMDMSEFFAPYGHLRWGGLSSSALYDMCGEALENRGNYLNLHQLILEGGQVIPVLFRTYAVYMERGLLEDLNPARDNVFWYSSGRRMEDILVSE